MYPKGGAQWIWQQINALCKLHLIKKQNIICNLGDFLRADSGPRPIVGLKHRYLRGDDDDKEEEYILN